MDEENLGFNDDSLDLPVEKSTEDSFNEPEDLDTEEVTEPTSEDTEPVQEQQELTPQQRKLKVKVDREERELSEEEAIPFIQKGMVADRLIARAAQGARDAYIKEQGYTWNDKPITNEAEYKQALAEQEMQKKYENLPPEVAQELIESRRDREERAKEKQEKEAEAKQQAEYNEFFQVFEEANDRRFDPKTDKLPQEVIDMANSGVPLQTAYLKHHNKQLKTSLITAKQNATNQSKAPVGSITAHGNNAKEAVDPFLEGWNS